MRVYLTCLFWVCAAFSGVFSREPVSRDLWFEVFFQKHLFASGLYLFGFWRLDQGALRNRIRNCGASPSVCYPIWRRRL